MARFFGQPAKKRYLVEDFLPEIHSPEKIQTVPASLNQTNNETPLILNNYEDNTTH